MRNIRFAVFVGALVVTGSAYAQKYNLTVAGNRVEWCLGRGKAAP